jgi:peroxin-13
MLAQLYALFFRILYILRISNLDPSSVAFKEAFAVAQNSQTLDGQPAKSIANKPSSWPVLLFLGFIMSAPYLIMKMLGTVSEKALEETRDPQTWVSPIRAHASYDFATNSPGELSFRQGQKILVAPKEVQNTQKLLNTGWVLASLDNRTSGLIPVNYIRGPKQMAQPTPYDQMPSVAPNIPDVLDTVLLDNDPQPVEVPENLFDESVLN